MLKRTLKWAAVAVAAIVLLLIVVIAMQPSQYRVERSIKITGPAADAFAQVDDFHKWPAWSPWEKVDPEMKRTYEGPEAGKGAIYRWNGNAEVGSGSMTIAESRPSELIKLDMHFLTPMEGLANAQFDFKPDGDQTLVTWSMSGDKNFMAKAIHLLLNMDEMIGGQFAKGLENLKGIVEAKPAGQPAETPSVKSDPGA